MTKTPEQWLEEVSPAPRTKGILKLFLGYAPGVGKTYSMLSEAIRRRSRGEDVVAGVIETHGRKGIADLAAQLEQVPRKKIEYKGTTFEEMDPDAAADLLGDLTEAHSDEILQEMEPEERQEVTQLLEFGEHTAAGRMTTEFIAVSETAVVDDAIEALKSFEGSAEAVATIYLTGASHKLVGAVPLVKIAISSPAIQLSALSEPYIACAPDTPQDEVAALFDKYNLITLAVVDEHGRIAGIITADDVITMLRHSD